jgi:DNA replication and repair protein RecF
MQEIRTTFISGLWLQSFRNYSEKVFEFTKPITVLVGANGIGKTSILEALSFLSSGESFRASKVEEMIYFDAEYSRVQSRFEVLGSDEDSTTLEALINTGSVLGKKTQKRVFSINGVRRLRKEVVGRLLTVIFRPEDLRLVEGSKARRRAYLDGPLSLVDPQYSQALKDYEHLLRRRNKILEQIKERKTDETSLVYWDENLLKTGEYIQEKRAAYIDTFAQVAFPKEFSCTYQPSLLNAKRLAQYQSRSIAAGHTLIGPHKDDFMIELESRDVAAYGSRGQQRLAVLWLKICERAFLVETTQTLPVLLLDDIFSELDSHSQGLIFSLMSQGQTIITSADHRVADRINAHFNSIDVIDLLPL